MHIDWPLLQRIGIWLEQIKRKTERKLLVSWLGGEPFQWPTWLQASKFFAEQLELSLSVTTNGLALEKEPIRNSAVSLFKQITISVDGLACYHDHLRQADGMFDRMRTIVAKINETAGRDHLLLRANTILTRDNIESFGEFCNAMANWGFDELTFNPLGGNDRPEFYPENRLKPDQIQRFCDRLESIRDASREQGMVIRGSKWYLQRMLATARRQPIAIAECNPGGDFLFIDEHGRLSPCSFTVEHFSQPMNRPLQIAEHSSVELASIVHHFKAVRRERCPSACSDCHANHVYAKFG